MFNPIKCIHHFFNTKIKEIEDSDKDTYTKEEVCNIIKDLKKIAYSSIRNSTFIFNINEEQEIGINEDISAAKLLVDENKYILFIRCTNEQIENYEFINKLKQYRNKHDYIVDIIVVDFDTDISLVTARLAKSNTTISDEDYYNNADEEVLEYQDRFSKWDSYYATDFVYTAYNTNSTCNITYDTKTTPYYL